MAASGRHVGHCLQKNGQFLLNNIDRLWSRRGFHWSPLLHQQTAEATTESTESIELPKKKTWSKVAVLEALASTVKRDPTAYEYQFQDDPYLYPRKSTEYVLFALSQESGRAAAKYFINSNPRYFEKDFAEPHIPCLMPESVELTLDEVSEEALKERLKLRRVTAAVDMFDQLLQSGTTISMETTHDLLDLISFYCDQNPDAEPTPEIRGEVEEAGEEFIKSRGKLQKVSKRPKPQWKENNNAERIFNLLPERDTRCYSALIRGMVKHEAYSRAFIFHTDLLNNRLKGDVHLFNALIIAAPRVRDTRLERWQLMTELLGQMQTQKVQPNLLTFNSVLKSLKSCGHLSRSYSLETLNEMKALGIAPSLASYDCVLTHFHRKTEINRSYDILQDILCEIRGTSFTCQDPDDVLFFSSAMKICLDNKDLKLAYELQALVEVGQNSRLVGDMFQQTIYYGRFLRLLSLLEPVDVVLSWYRKLVPSCYYPNVAGLNQVFHAMDADSRLDLLPSFWTDICTLGHENKLEMVEELLSLMSRDQHSPEVQREFADCALKVKAVLDTDRGRKLEWNASVLSHITALLLRAEHTQKQAWETLKLFKEKNRIPRAELIEEFVSAYIGSGSSDEVVELVQISAFFCLPCTPRLVERAIKELSLSDEQRFMLLELESTADLSKPSDQFEPETMDSEK